MNILQTLIEVKNELRASIEKAYEAIAASETELTELDVKKSTLQAEVMTLSKAVEPLRKEVEGQRRSTQEIFAEQEKAGKALDTIKAAIVREQQDLDKRRADAEKVIEEAKIGKLRDLEKQIADLEAKLAAKQKAYDDFIAKLSK